MSPWDCHAGAYPERYEILPLPLRYTQSQGQNDRSEGLRMTVSEGAHNDNEKGRNDGYKGSLLLGIGI